MLTFIIPVKSKTITRSWDLLSRLLERTLKSICRQTSSRFSVVVVCNERPDIQFTHPNIYYLEVDFPAPVPVPKNFENRQGYEYIHSLDIARKNADKARKILAGVDFVKSDFPWELKPTHLMIVDADDCVSCRLAAFVEQHPNADGWVMRRGYMYREGGKILYVNLRRFNHVSGTSIIVRTDLYHALFENPEFYFCSFDQLPGIDMRPLPFPGALYSMMNGENILMSAQTFDQMQGQILSSIPALVQKLFRYRVKLLDRSVIQEFGLYDVNLKT
jgi:hypothetical protein